MTKQERKQLKKDAKRQAKRQAVEREQRKKVIRKWGTIAAAVLAILLGTTYVIVFRLELFSQTGTLRIAKTEHNFGVVAVQTGIVNVEIQLVNIGEGALTISGMESSCGCTRASIVNNGQEGPTFGMAGHGGNPANWQAVIKPGERAVLKIYYNPKTHPNLRGAVTRVVTIYSDDPLNPKQEVRIKVNQIG